MDESSTKEKKRKEKTRKEKKNRKENKKRNQDKKKKCVGHYGFTKIAKQNVMI